MARSFVTLPQELQAAATACFDRLRQAGHAVKAEYADESLPEAATFFYRDGREQYFCIFDTKIRNDRLTLWSGYGRSCASTTFVTLFIPDTVNTDVASIAVVRSLGIGVTVVDATFTAIEVLAPSDLSMNISLPPLGRHKRNVRKQLSKAHQKFDRGDWKGGFESSCKIVEKAARAYLMRYARQKMVQIPGKAGRPKEVTPDAVSAMPMGALKDVFCKKLGPTHLDSLLCSGLGKINNDRINVAHDKLNAQSERRLRDNVGRHMWTIDNLLLKLAA